MFKWLGGANHAFSNPRRAREKLAGLPGDNALKALEELSDWIESLTGLDLEARADICKLFDEHSRPYRRKLWKDYLGADGAQRKRISFACHRFASLMGKAYFSCIKAYRSGEKGADEIKKELPLLICRALHALHSQYKWSHLHAGLIEPSLWKNLFWLFAFAEKTGIARIALTLYPGQGYKTSILQEFLKTPVMAASSPDSLSSREFDMANHMVALLSGHFILESKPGAPDLTHYVDLSSSNPPARLKPSLGSETSLRFFGPGKACTFIAQLPEAGLPEEITLGGTYSEEESRKVLKHLLIYWSEKPLSRKSERRRASLTFAVACRLDWSETESWTSENISEGGFDAVIQNPHPEWEKIGLLFFSKQGGSWDLCIIRRLSRDDLKRWHAGVEILAKAILPIEIGKDNSSIRIVLAHIEAGAMEAKILAEDKNFFPNSRYEIEFEGKKYALIPLERLEKGFDFRLWRCRLADL